ncbi:MAG TPA: hypothetical protein VN901_15545 [Candidatus Acidoferrales bacterium]|nr:hypothetical protein [Candidatus Acidoferrales bacterium]
MSVPLEYHEVVNCSGRCPARRSIPTSLALFGMLLLPILVSTSRAQISTSSAGSVHSASLRPPTAAVIPPTAVRVAPPSGISVGQAGTPLVSSGFTRPPNISRDSHGNRDGHHPHHSAEGTAYYPFVYGMPVPYAVDVNDADNSNEEDDDPEYLGGPTIFDRRGSGRDSYVPPSSPGPAQARDASADQSGSDPAPDPPQPPTTLVFKDGRQLEVNNYAIVSQTLYDLTPGHPRKIALADLDLPATQKQNDDRGVVFQLPPSAQAN